MQQVVALIRQEPVLQNEWVSALAAEEGFDDSWMALDHPGSAPVPKRGKAAALAAAQLQQTLPKMMATAVASKATAPASVPVVVPANAGPGPLTTSPQIMGPPAAPKATARPAGVSGAPAKVAGPMHLPAAVAVATPILSAPSLPAVPPPLSRPDTAVTEAPSEVAEA